MSALGGVLLSHRLLPGRGSAAATGDSHAPSEGVGPGASGERLLKDLDLSCS